MTVKSILITGCSSGIGYDAAHELRTRGWRVFASCRQEADCQRLRGEGFESPLIDYTDFETIHSGLAAVLEATGGTLDALFNNGAYGLPGAVEDLPTEALQHIFQTNVFGWHELTLAVIPIMRAQGHGRIINNSSVLGFITFPWRGAYVASKFALEGLTDTLRIEMRDTPIHVVLIQPGPIATDFRKNSVKGFQRWIDWEKSARAEQYRNSLLKRLYAAQAEADFFELPASAVTKKLIHALEAKRPKARYMVTTPTYALNIVRRVFPTRLLDWIIAKG